MSNDSGVIARTEGEAGDSIARFKGWVQERPWHLWLSLIVAVAILYLTYRIYKQNQANAASGGSSGSSGGFFGGLSGPANTPTATPSAAVASGATSTTTTTTQQYATTTQAEPLYQVAQDLGWGANPAALEWDPLGPFNGKSKPSYADIIPAGIKFHVPSGGSGPSASATETWITSSVTATS